MGQLAAQHRLVEAAEHPLMPLQVAGIERPPPAIVGLHLGRASRRACGSGDRRPATSSGGTSPSSGLGCPDAAGHHHDGSSSSTRTAPDARAPRSRRRHGPPRGDGRRSATTTRSATSAPRTSRQSPPPHGPLDHRGDAIDQLAAERHPRNGVTARQHQLQRFRRDGARQSEIGRLPPAPDARHLTWRAGQIPGVVRRRLRRRRRVNRRHPQHQMRHPIAHTGTCLQKPDRAEVATYRNTGAQTSAESGGW